MTTARFDMEKFTGKNDFGLWKIKMRAILIQQGLWDAMKEEEKGANVDDKAAVKRQEVMEKAHSAIILSLGDGVLREVAKEKSAAAVWSKLESIYMTKSLANRLFMKQKLYSFKFQDGKSISDQLQEFTKAVDDLEAIDVEIVDEDKAIILSNALPRSYEQLKDAILYGRDSTITLEEVVSALKVKEFQKSGLKAMDPAGESLYVKPKNKKGSKKKFQKKAKGGKDAGEGKETRSCHYCKKPGHLKKNCYSWKKKQQDEGNGTSTADIAEEVETAQILNVIEEDIGESWIMDSGCSFHMCSHTDWFEKLEKSSGNVLLGNDHVCRVMGIGSIRLKMNDGSIKILSEVRYIPDIKRNLVSLGALESKGCSFMSSGGVLKVMKDSKVMMTARRRQSLYYLLADVIKGNLNAVSDSDLGLWHLRLGHVSEAGLKQLIKKGVISASKSDKLKACEECVLGKSKKQPYGAGKHTSEMPLDYAHSDIWGPSPVPSIGGCRYFLTFIDDFSRKIWIYVMKEKSETFIKFKEWCTEVEVEKQTSLKCLRTDNGLEFLSHEFDEFCKLKGIKRHRTVPNNPQQNGVAERANRTILERVRCMLQSSGMQMRFWGEAVATAVVLLNKCPSSAIDMDTPDFRWYGSHGDYSKLKPFGCRAYSHVRRSKLEARAIKCVMLGYQKGVKGYRLWSMEPGNNKVIISRDITFREQEMPYLSAGKQTEVSQRTTSVEVELLDDLELNDPDESNDQDVTEIQDMESDHEQNDLENYQLARDRERRKITPPARYSNSSLVYYALCVAEGIDCSEPANYKEAMKCRERDKWIRAMKDEIESLIKNKTWILVTRSKLQKLVGCKWIFKKKVEAADGNRIRFKARLVAKGYTQKEGIDYNEVFSPVVKHSSIRILMAVVAHNDWELQQMDVKTAFLHGELEESIYMEQPEGFIKTGDEDKVCLLKRSLYGLKQSSRQWNIQFNEHMMDIGFDRSKYDDCVYMKKRDGKTIAYLLLYVDDMLIAGSSKAEIDQIKKDLNSRFEMKDLGDAKRILGMDIIRDRRRRTLWLTQQDYVSKVLNKFQMADSRSVTTPMGQHFRLSAEQKPQTEEERKEMSSIPYANIVGSVMYMMVCTRPDIAHAISTVSRYMADPGKVHWQALKWILRYLKGSASSGILYKGDHDVSRDAAMGYCDSDFATNCDNRKSQTGYIFTLYGSAISWKSGLQSVVALSTTEAEYMALAEAVKESFWIKGILNDFGVKQTAIVVHCDSSSAISLTKHQVFHERSKHIDVRLHFIRDEVNKGEVKVQKIGTEHNPADMLTKVLPVSKYVHCLDLVNVLQR